MAKYEEVKKGVIFPVGERNDAYTKYFVGQSYLKTLVADPKINVGVGNVTFEPGCRNNWHIQHFDFNSIVNYISAELCALFLGLKCIFNELI